MKDLERKIQELTFDVETQYCDPSDCFFDCYHDYSGNAERRGNLPEVL